MTETKTNKSKRRFGLQKVFKMKQKFNQNRLIKTLTNKSQLFNMVKIKIIKVTNKTKVITQITKTGRNLSKNKTLLMIMDPPNFKNLNIIKR